jgi:hypothetical protein
MSDDRDSVENAWLDSTRILDSLGSWCTGKSRRRSQKYSVTGRFMTIYDVFVKLLVLVLPDPTGAFIEKKIRTRCRRND